MFASKHSHHGIPTRGHLHHGIPTRGHLHHDIPTRSIYIMTYPLEDIFTTIFLHLYLCKETLASRSNMCAGIIMNKPCVSIPAWDIYIMEITFASLSGSICIRNKKCDSRVKTRKGSLEQKRKFSKTRRQSKKKRMKGQRPDSI